MNAKPLMLSPLLRIAGAITAAIDIIVGLLFLFGPELGLTLWPTPIPRELMRFIGSIVFANGIGAAMVVQRPTWENARVLVAVALIYGAAVFLGLIIDLLAAGAPPIFWGYVIGDAIFLFPVVYLFLRYERLWRANQENQR